ncbi:pro-neuregulin-3, membrane-bound isoform-like [Clarias magur]|uniref:Pro-neuregulin-3, membrane-bound isoform-like n=1 Tax=Clarias magur TaxID=1594786 RepID=A0A8J4T3D5_CLAMG|nr:pro-neuregulin-3, membrane-bound isoform-like [Clarias magur]
MTAPTLPPLKSEHFKPCQEKDLAYCLNDGECFVIETLSGPHKHCSRTNIFSGGRGGDVWGGTTRQLPGKKHVVNEIVKTLGCLIQQSGIHRAVKVPKAFRTIHKTVSVGGKVFDVK